MNYRYPHTSSSEDTYGWAGRFGITGFITFMALIMAFLMVNS